MSWFRELQSAVAEQKAAAANYAAAESRAKAANGRVWDALTALGVVKEDGWGVTKAVVVRDGGRLYHVHKGGDVITEVTPLDAAGAPPFVGEGA